MRILCAVALAACGHRSVPRASTTTLAITVTDGGAPVAARVLLFN